MLKTARADGLALCYQSTSGSETTGGTGGADVNARAPPFVSASVACTDRIRRPRRDVTLPHGN